MQNGSSIGICTVHTHSIHVLVPICILSLCCNKISASELSRKFIKSALFGWVCTTTNVDDQFGRKCCSLFWELAQKKSYLFPWRGLRLVRKPLRISSCWVSNPRRDMLGGGGRGGGGGGGGGRRRRRKVEDRCADLKRLLLLLFPSPYPVHFYSLLAVTKKKFFLSRVSVVPDLLSFLCSKARDWLCTFFFFFLHTDDLCCRRFTKRETDQNKWESGDFKKS